MERIPASMTAEYLVRLDQRLSTIERALVPAVVDVPHLSGSAVVGGTLNCTMGNWEKMDAEPHSYAFGWQSDGAAVGEGEVTYIVAESDVGHSITCVVTATNAFGSTAAPPSNAVQAAAAAATSARAHRGS
jgi:hypothetical protein